MSNTQSALASPSMQSHATRERGATPRPAAASTPAVAVASSERCWKAWPCRTAHSTAPRRPSDTSASPSRRRALDTKMLSAPAITGVLVITAPLSSSRRTMRPEIILRAPLFRAVNVTLATPTKPFVAHSSVGCQPQEPAINTWLMGLFVVHSHSWSHSHPASQSSSLSTCKYSASNRSTT